MADKNMNAKISVDFEESASRQSLNSGDSLPTLFGKTKKFFSDLKPVALSGSYDDLTDTPESSTPVLNTSTGNSITITDGADAPLIELGVYGKSVQDSTPTPEAPVDIVSVGEMGIEITSCRKNLWEGSQDFSGEWVNGSLWLDADETYNGLAVKYKTSSWSGIGRAFTLALNTPYTVSFYAKTNEGQTLEAVLATVPDGADYNNFNTAINVTSEWTRYSLTFVCAEYPDVLLRVGANSTATAPIYLCGFQLEKSNVVTEYEGYKGNTAFITSGLPLCSIGEYRDELIYNADGTGKIIKRIRKVVFNGSETTWSINGTEDAAKKRMRLALADTDKCLISDDFGLGVISDKYPTVTNGSTYKCIEGISASNTQGTYLAVYDEAFATATIDEWKTHLAANPITVIYVLNTPQEIKLSAAEMAELMQLHTFDGVTNIYNDEGAEIYTKYWCDSNINALLNTKASINHTHTATDIGLGNVENKSSDTIRSELTADNVTEALGYTPMEDTTVPITKGGTGATTANAAEYNLSGNIVEGGGDFTDDSRMACVYKTPSSANGVFFYQTVSKLWNYIKGKISSVLGLTSTQYNGNASTATNATKVNNHTVESDVPANAVFTDTKYTLSSFGVTSTATELNYTDGVTSNIQTQLDNKAVIQTLASVDLDDVKTEGFYSAGGSNNCDNRPTGVDHFGLYVIHRANGDYYTQILIGSNYKQYRRHCDNSVWSPWVEDKLTDTIYTPPNSGVTAGTYRSVTVNAQGFVTAGSNPTITIEQGGTGATSAKAAEYNLLKDIPESTAALTDNAIFVFKKTTPDSTNGVFVWKYASLIWNYIKGKADSVYAVLSHTHTKSEITDMPTTMANPNALTVKLNSGTTEGTNMFTYTGSTTKSVNITPSAIGAATTSAATTSANGLMTTTMVTKLNSIAEGANKTTVDTAISSTSENPVQNKVIKTELDKKLDKSGDIMDGILIAQSNTDYTIAQVRNVTMSTEAASGGSNGQIHYQYE